MRIFVLSIAILIITGIKSDSSAASCCSLKQGSGPRVGAFAGNILKAKNFIYNPHEDTIENLASIYGYYGNSWDPDGHTGDPLGTGGKLPLLYTTELYRDQGVENQALVKNDMRTQYVDFGYIPLWRANTLSGYGKWRMSPELLAQYQMVYGGDPGKPGTNSNGSIGIGEVSLQWAPVNYQNFWIKAGNIIDGGTYTSIFDQSPIENFIYTGLTASLAGNLNSIKTVTSISFGGNYLNSVYLRNQEDGLPAGSPGFTRASRQRTYLYAKSNLLFSNKFGLKVVGGMQFVPEDSSLKMFSKSGSDPFYHYPKGIGGMGGMEATWFGTGQFHTFVISGAYGDAMIGSSTPDAVLKPVVTNPVVLDKLDVSYDPFAWEFSRQKSSLINFIYWNGIESGKIHFTGGMWFTVRFPEKTSMSFVNPMADSIRKSDPDRLMQDSIVTVQPENFEALKISLFPTYQIGYSPLYIGIRFDNITFLTPNAHTNAIELERDQTLRAANTNETSLYSPSLWDREAVNANILTPSLRLDFKELGGITVAYSFAFYDKPVDRQGKISDRHSNLTICADISLTNNGLKKLFH